MDKLPENVEKTIILMALSKETMNAYCVKRDEPLQITSHFEILNTTLQTTGCKYQFVVGNDEIASIERAKFMRGEHVENLFGYSNHPSPRDLRLKFREEKCFHIRSQLKDLRLNNFKHNIK